MWCGAATSARLRITYDGTNFDNSDWHGGSDEWEELTIDSGIDADATEFTISCEVVDAATGFFDDVTCRISSTVARYVLPSTVRAIKQIEQQCSRSKPDGRYEPIGWRNPPRPDYVLRIRGTDMLSRPSTEAGTTEIDGEHIDLLVTRAAAEFWRMQWVDSQLQHHRELRDDAMESFRLLQRGSRMVRIPTAMREGWHEEADSTTRYVVFER